MIDFGRMNNSTPQHTARFALIIGAFYGLTGVALGAMAAHALKAHLEPDALASFETGVRYQMYHALLLTALGFVHPPRWAVWLFTAGVGCFSGSIYLLTLAHLKAVWFVTPLGGVLLMAGWAVLLAAALRGRVTRL